MGEDGNLSDTYTVIVYEPNYFEQLDEALNSDSDFDNETIGMEIYIIIWWSKLQKYIFGQSSVNIYT